MGKRQPPSQSKSEEFIDDSDAEEQPKPAKKAKKQTKEKAPKKPTPASDSDESDSGSKDKTGEILKNDDGDTYVDLGSLKRATVRKFNKAILIDFREYYTDKSSGDAKPGKKGLALTVPQFEALKAAIASGELDEAVKKLQK